MIKKNQNGFTLILSLVLLLVMSLMGGSLIVIASGDHQSNNTSDQYQQTFYVAEHALIEAQKHLVNRMKGPWVTNQDLENCGTEGEDCNIGNYNQSLPDDMNEEDRIKHSILKNKKCPCINLIKIASLKLLTFGE